MADFNSQQRQITAQVQILSQRQIHSLKILSLSNAELKNEIEKAIRENPAISYKPDKTRTSSKTSASLEEASDRNQMALENQMDERETLQHHLLDQLYSLNLTEREIEVGENLIYNLDKNGFNRQVTTTFINSNSEKPMLAKLTELIQNFEPEGCCTNNWQESLFVQAKNSETQNALALFILDGKFETFLQPPIDFKIISERIKKYYREQKNKFGAKEPLKKIPCEIENVMTAVNFIKSLNPHPGTNYSCDSTHYIEPDIYIKKIEPYEIKYDTSFEYVNDGKNFYRIELPSSFQDIEISSDYLKVKNNSSISKEKVKAMNSDIKKAAELIKMIQMRESTLLKACFFIFSRQIDFLNNGKGHLHPLRQKDVAEYLKLHETTISRMANNKYVQCSYGFFKLKYFFSNSVSKDSSKNVSKDNVFSAIKSIVENAEKNPSSQKKLSDEKIRLLLEQQGIKIARRTVAKYRSELEIASSYARK